jgi:hypothetical protein
MYWRGRRGVAVLLCGLEEPEYLIEKLPHAAVSLLQALELSKEAQRRLAVVLSRARRHGPCDQDLRVEDMHPKLVGTWANATPIDRQLASSEAPAASALLTRQRSS